MIKSLIIRSRELYPNSPSMARRWVRARMICPTTPRVDISVLWQGQTRFVRTMKEKVI